MTQAKLSADVLIDTLRIFELNNRNISEAARQINVNRTTFAHRLKTAQSLLSDDRPQIFDAARWTYPRMISIDAPKTRWIIGSDLHVWSGEPPIIYKAFIAVAKKLKVDGIILNGDIIDGARVSRHPAIRGSAAPKIEVEIETANTNCGRWAITICESIATSLRMQTS
jgi:PucR C-terminal helix-turn-helix domain